MNDLQVNLKTDGMARAVIASVTEQHVTIDISETDKWNVEGLLKLSAMLKGVAATLAATALLLSCLLGNGQTVDEYVDRVTESKYVQQDYTDSY